MSGATVASRSPGSSFSVTYTSGMGGADSAVQYTVISNPPVSFTLQTGPGSFGYLDANYVPDPDAGYAPGSAGASVYYNVSVTNVDIVPTGATKDSTGAYDILVGQQCSPTVVLTDMNGSEYGISYSMGGPTVTYAWDATGETFQTWQPTTPGVPAQGTTPAVPANYKVSYYVGGLGDKTLPNPAWYWNDPANKEETITCALTMPVGQDGQTITVNPTRIVNVYVPKVDGIQFNKGYVQVNDHLSGISGTTLYAGPASGMNSGLNWSATVHTPQTPVRFDQGWLQWVQTTVPAYTETTADGTYPLKTRFPDPNAPSTQTPPVGLDTKYPYNFGQKRGENDGTPYTTVDNPYIPLNSNITSATLSGTWTMYLMYMPPGGATAWVPLAHSSPWGVNATATQPSDGWASYLMSHLVNGQTVTDWVGDITGGELTISNDFPKWFLIDDFQFSDKLQPQP